MDINNQNKCPNTRQHLINFGQKYITRMYPKFQSRISDDKTMGSLSGRMYSPWFDVNNFSYSATPSVSTNGTIYNITGTANTLFEGFYSIGLFWKGRRDGQVYKKQTVMDQPLSPGISGEFEDLGTS